MLLQQWHRKWLKCESSYIGISWPLLPSAIACNTYFTHIYWTSVCVKQNTTKKTFTRNLSIQIPFWLRFHFAPSSPPRFLFVRYVRNYHNSSQSYISETWNLLFPSLKYSYFQAKCHFIREAFLNHPIQYRIPCHFWIPTLLFFCIALITIRFVQCLFSQHIFQAS